MKIFLLGAQGQVGSELKKLFSLPNDTSIFINIDTIGQQADLRYVNSLRSRLCEASPDIIINAAAYTAVDQAESEPDQAEAVNAIAPGVLAEEAKRVDAWLIHYSTDYVFDGSGIQPWRESDTPAPLNIYGRTKLTGEQAIQASGCKHLIFRTSWVHSARRQNFIRTMLRLGAERDQLAVIKDQRGAPTSAALIADVTAKAIQQALEQPEKGGLYHLTASGETTWYAYARRVLEKAREGGWPVKVADEAIKPVSTSEFPTPAKRPLNSRLDTTRLQSTFGVRLPPWEEDVDRVVAEILENELPIEPS